MSKTQFTKPLMFAIVSGLILTIFSYVYNRGPQTVCSNNPALNAVIDCALPAARHGLPFTWLTGDITGSRIVPPLFILDWIIWALISLAALMFYSQIGKRKQT